MHGLGLDAPMELIKNQADTVLPVADYRGMIVTGACPATRCLASELVFPQSSADVFGGYLYADGLPSWFGTLLDGQTDASGYIYRRNRYLDPQTGRFTQEDPIGLAGGLNVYGFASGDPVNFSDPFGLCPPQDNDPNTCPGLMGAFVQLGQMAHAINKSVAIAGAVTMAPIVIMMGADAVGGGLAVESSSAGVSSAEGEAVSATEGQLGQLTKQLANDGRGSVEKSLRTFEKRLSDHLTRIDQIEARGGNANSLKTEVRNFRGLIDAAKQVLQDQ